MTKKVRGSIHSDIGFYVGDVCYALGEDVYYGFWGVRNNFDDGVYEVPGGNAKFAVASTAYGDGEYMSNDGRMFWVDAGNLGIVPLELAERERADELGYVFLMPGTAEFCTENGVFEFTLPNRNSFTVDTRYDEEDEEYDEEI